MGLEVVWFVRKWYFNTIYIILNIGTTFLLKSARQLKCDLFKLNFSEVEPFFVIRRDAQKALFKPYSKSRSLNFGKLYMQIGNFGI